MEKLLAGSDFSLANPEDMELDYYDYNVTNASAAPGSYLGMDPAMYMVWIPPLMSEMVDDSVAEEEFEEGAEEPETEKRTDDVDDNKCDLMEEHHYEEILPRHKGIDPGSNTETPSEEVPPKLPVANECIPMTELIRKPAFLLKHAGPLNMSPEPEQPIRDNRTTVAEEEKQEHFDAMELKQKGSHHHHHQNTMHKYYHNYYEQMDDIQFADDDDEM